MSLYSTYSWDWLQCMITISSWDWLKSKNIMFTHIYIAKIIEGIDFLLAWPSWLCQSVLQGERFEDWLSTIRDVLKYSLSWTSLPSFIVQTWTQYLFSWLVLFFPSPSTKTMFPIFWMYMGTKTNSSTLFEEWGIPDKRFIRCCSCGGPWNHHSKSSDANRSKILPPLWTCNAS